MRFRSLIGEAIRNITTGTARAGLLAIILVVASTALLMIDAAAIAGLQSRAHNIRDHAGAIRVLVAKNAIDPAACSNLSHLESIDHAGPIWQLDPIRLLALPRVDIPVFLLSPGVARTVGIPSARTGGKYIPETLATRWHAGEGSQLDTSNGPITLDGVFRYPEDDGRDPRLANAIVIVGETTSRASECWYGVWPPSNAVDQFAFGAIATAGQGDAAPQVAPLNPTVGQQFNFSREYTDRVTALAAPAVALVFALVAFGGMTRRRMEIAGNLHAGARRRDIITITAIEAALWATGSGVATFVLTRLAGRVLFKEPVEGYETSLAITILAAIIAAILGAMPPAILTREDRLFSIFKARA